MQSKFNIIHIHCLPYERFDTSRLEALIASKLSVSKKEIPYYKIRKSSIDARGKSPLYSLQIELSNHPFVEKKIQFKANNVSNKPEVYIIGFGPAGIFAALRLIELGLKPVVIERGKDVKSRRRDLAKLTKEHTVNPESNYCFGEGGAGTYSDGKLYTRSNKRGDIKRILSLFIEAGADEDILINARPHIGTNKLPDIIVKLREQILACGGEVRFNTCLKKIKHQFGKISELELSGGEIIKTENVILATGHSSRLIYEMLHQERIRIEAKPFALGVRAEHPQELIDEIQYKTFTRGEYLPPAYYSLVSQVSGRGVYSFCMCPGGIIAPCATNEGEIVTNGWSPSKRNNPFANSGIVTEIDFREFGEKGTLAALNYQKAIEQKAYSSLQKGQTAPAQRMVDFSEKKISNSLPVNSYIPGTESIELGEVFPTDIAKRLRQAFKEFGKKMKGYYTNEAILVGVETRTSAPVRIPRNPETLEHIQIEGLFPCAEGAGYAGGIVSAAIDGEKCAEAVAKKLGITIKSFSE